MCLVAFLGKSSGFGVSSVECLESGGWLGAFLCKMPEDSYKLVLSILNCTYRQGYIRVATTIASTLFHRVLKQP